MAEYSQADRPMRVDTALGEDVLLLSSFSAVEALSDPFTCELDMLSTDAALSPADILRTGALITWLLPDGSPRKMHGLVRRFVQLDKRDDLYSYRAEVVPWLWFLTLSRESRIHQQKSVLDIIEVVFGDLGYSDFELRTTRTYPKRDYCVQYRETHFNFVSRLMEEEGLFYFFEHHDDKHVLVIADGNDAAESVPGAGTARVHSHVIHDEDIVLSLQREDNVFSGKVTLRSYDYLQPSLSLENSLTGDGKEEIYDYPGNYLSLEEGDRYARLRLEAEEVRRQVLRGTGNCRNFGSGLTVELEEAERGGAVTKVLLLEVRHSMSGNSVRGWESGGSADYRNSFFAIPFETPFRPRRRAHKALVTGTQTAMVVVAEAEEIWSDKYGRVKVQFYWDRTGTRNEESSCWVRVATPWAGKGWGAIHLPRKGQEVIVDFLEGDPDRPIIIGSVYNAEQMPPYTLPANVTQSGVKSRSSTQGEEANFNEIRMEDKKGSELLYIHAEKDKSVIVEADRTENVGANETITIGENRSESVGDNETISIGSNRSESVGKDESVTIGKKRAHSIGTNDSLDVGGNRTVNVSGNSTTKVDKNTSLTVGDSLTVSVAKNHKEETKKNYSLKAEKIFIEGTNEIEIKSGSASIILKKNGDIQIKGGKINIKGSGDVVIKGSKIGEN